MLGRPSISHVRRPTVRYRLVAAQAERDCEVLTAIAAMGDPDVSKKGRRCAFQPARVVGPMQDRLPLAPPAFTIAGLAVVPDRGGVAGDRAPPPDLARVIGRAAS